MSSGTVTCHHDLMGKVGSLEEMREVLTGWDTGDSDSGLLICVPKIKALFPQSKWVLVLREWQSAMDSLDTFLSTGPWAAGQLGKEAKAFLAVESHKGAQQLSFDPLCLTVRFDDMDSLDTAEAIWKHCLPNLPFNEDRWRVLNGLNIQLDQRKTAFTPKNSKILS